MTRKLLIFSGALLILLFLPRCGTDYYWVVGYTMNLQEKNEETGYYQDTDLWKTDVRIRLTEVIRYESEDDHIAHLFHRISFVSDCKAFQKAEKPRNHILRESFILQFDSDIRFKGELIKAGTNLITVKDFPFSNVSGDYSIIFAFDKELFSHISFAQEEVSVIFRCKTSDNRSILAQKTVKIAPSKVYGIN